MGKLVRRRRGHRSDKEVPMSIFSWPSERAKLEGYRRMNGYALPLTLWTQFLAGSAGESWRSFWLVDFAWFAVPMLVLWWVTKPLAGLSVESTARSAGEESRAG